MADDLDAMIAELKAMLPAPLGLRLACTNPTRGEYRLYDDFGPVAECYSDAIRRIEAALARLSHLVKCCSAVAKENKRLKEREEWIRRMVSAAEFVVHQMSEDAA